MSPGNIVVIGGIYNIGFAVFHLLFWKLFRWREDLASLTSLNRAVMQILNLCLTFAFVLFAFVSLFHSVEMVSTALGRSLLLLIAIFWFLRAVEQIVFFGLRRVVSVVLFLIFIAGFALYTLPLVV
jgi:hypothetical protein